MFPSPTILALPSVSAPPPTLPVHRPKRPAAVSALPPLTFLLALGTIASLYNVACGVFRKTVQSSYREPVTSRPYRVFIREGHARQRPAPVLFALHPYATAPDVLLRAFSLEALAVRERGYILVVPEGLRDQDGNYAWNASRACCGAGPQRPDDLAYLQGVLRDVQERFAVDPTQVMALGVSNGGFMAHRWACSGGALSAIVSVSGAGQGPTDPACSPRHPIAILQIHGDQDEVIRYEGGHMRGAPYPSALDSLKPLLEAAGTKAPPSVARQKTFFFGTIRKQTWSDGAAPVALWTVEGGPHHLRAAQASVPAILDFLEGR